VISIRHKGKIVGAVSEELFPRAAMMPYHFVRFLGVLAMVVGVENESDGEATVDLVSCSPRFVLEESLRRAKLGNVKP
jgi:hypothetical protein